MMEGWTLPSRRVLSIAAIVVAIVLIASGAAWWWSTAQEHRAEAAYADAMTRLAAASAPNATPESKAAAARALEDVVKQYPSGTNGAKAALDLGNVRYDNHEYAAARGAYDIAAARGGSTTVRTLARSGSAHTWESERQFAKAADAYAALAQDLRPRDFLYEDTLLDLARAQEQAGRKSDAAATYERLLKNIPSSRHTDDVKRRLAALGAAAR
jgi:outer membrane protein assembly factor BamD (BamD/ComL family)